MDIDRAASIYRFKEYIGVTVFRLRKEQQAGGHGSLRLSGRV
jgi:hypothetical protein